MFNIYKLAVCAEPEFPSFSGLFHMFIEKYRIKTFNLCKILSAFSLLGFPWEFKNSVETNLLFFNLK